MKHTPGSWYVGETKAVGAYGGICINSDGPHVIAYCLARPDFQQDGESIVNAHLIAAAPELLRVLKGLMSIADNDSPIITAYRDRFAVAEAAIAKAEGREIA